MFYHRTSLRRARANVVSFHIVPTARDNIPLNEKKKQNTLDVPEAQEDTNARWAFADTQLLFALNRLHEARARIDKLEHAVVDAATQSERACEKLAYAQKDEANELVKNVCAMLKGVVRPTLA